MIKTRVCHILDKHPTPVSYTLSPKNNFKVGIILPLASALSLTFYLDPDFLFWIELLFIPGHMEGWGRSDYRIRVRIPVITSTRQAVSFF